MKSFKVVRNGIIQSGSATYSVSFNDPKKATISYSLSVKAGLFWPFVKTYSYAGTYSVDKKLFDPGNYESAGAALEVDGLKVKVISVTNYASSRIASLAIELFGNSGTAEVILNRPVELKSLKSEFTVNGKKLDLDLVESNG